MLKGKIKWFNDAKGYGFIISENGDEIFIHFSSIKMQGFKSLKKDQKVTYELINTLKGKQAFNIELIK